MRPVSFTEADHLANPEINTNSDEEAALANIVALHVQGYVDRERMHAEQMRRYAVPPAPTPRKAPLPFSTPTPEEPT